jgi:hypothetical protein
MGAPSVSVGTWRNHKLKQRHIGQPLAAPTHLPPAMARDLAIRLWLAADASDYPAK